MSCKLYKLIPFIIDIKENKIGIIGYEENSKKEIFLNYEKEVLLLKEKENNAYILHPDGIVWGKITDIYPLELEDFSKIESEKKQCQ